MLFIQCHSLFIQTCTKAVAYIEECTSVIKLSLDGKNQEVVLLEFGIRVHRVIYEMILTFTVNSAGKTRERERERARERERGGREIWDCGEWER